MRKSILIGAALILASQQALALNPFTPAPAPGYSETPGYIASCPSPQGGAFTYWFAMGFGTNVAVSKIGYPNGTQLQAFVFAGEPVTRGYVLRIRTEIGTEGLVRWRDSHGQLNINGLEMSCSVRKTIFVL